MGFRTGLVFGLVIGYVLGTRAGRRRYEQIVSWARSVSRSQPAQQLSEEMRFAANRAGEALEHKATEQVSRVSNLTRGGQSGGPAGQPTA